MATHTTLTGLFSDIADSIRAKTGSSSQIVADNFPTEIASIPTGDQPSLFAPAIVGGVNSISWSNNPSNGDYEVTLVADVDGTPVSSPLTVTQAMDGQTLTVTASAQGFTSATSTILIRYLPSDSSLIALSAKNATGNANEYIEISINDYDASYSGYSFLQWSQDGEEVGSRYFMLTSNGEKTDKTLIDQVSFTPKGNITKWSLDFYYRYGLTPTGATLGFGDYVQPANGAIQNQISATISIYDATESAVKWTGTISAKVSSWSSNQLKNISGRMDFVQGHTYTVIINATLSPL